MSARKPPEVTAFVSYSRRDGEQFAIELSRRLKRDHISLWRDRSEMAGG